MLKLKVVLFCLNQTKAVKELKVYLLRKGSTGKRNASSHIFAETFLSDCLPLSFLVLKFSLKYRSIFSSSSSTPQVKRSRISLSKLMHLVFSCAQGGSNSFHNIVQVSQDLKLF